MIKKWNKIYNLISTNKLKDILINHILDSISIIPYFSKKKQYILDVGSGCGLPGIILAIILSKSTIILNDIKKKKTAFQTQIKIELKLKNIIILNKDINIINNNHEKKFDIIISRAFSKLNTYINSVKNLKKKNGIIVAMKGIKYINEINKISKKIKIKKIIKINVPFLLTERYLINI